MNVLSVVGTIPIPIFNLNYTMWLRGVQGVQRRTRCGSVVSAIGGLRTTLVRQKD